MPSFNIAVYSTLAMMPSAMASNAWEAILQKFCPLQRAMLIRIFLLWHTDNNPLQEQAHWN